MPAPLLYEINTRCWLKELSLAAGRRLTLATVPESDLDHWSELGFTHIWLMGVWSSGPRSRATAIAIEDLWRSYGESLRNFRKTDVAGSPYAISGYHISPSFGGESALKMFRSRLNARGMKLILDFIPNHVGLDHPWVRNAPERFVQGEPGQAGTFLQETVRGASVLAHGKDPWFAPWSDTVQLEYRLADTRGAIREELKSVAARCDGVRCDMAMLILSDVFSRTWSEFPVRTAAEGRAAEEAEFWAEAIPEIRRAFPGFTFMAEVYWGLQSRLQSMGFDFTYHKELYDALIRRAPGDVQNCLLGASAEFLSRSVHFLENHDEPRAASQFSLPEHRAAAFLLLALPGMRLVHEGQLDGARLRVPVQFARRCADDATDEVRELYRELFRIVGGSALGRGEWVVIRPREAWAGNSSAQAIVIVLWKAGSDSMDLAAVNLASHAAQCYAPLPMDSSHDDEWLGCDRFGGGGGSWRSIELLNPGILLDLPPHGICCFELRKVQPNPAPITHESRARE